MAARLVINAGFCAWIGAAAGCGSTIGQLDTLPAIPVDEAAPWPRLVDMPEPPEARLTAGSGEAARARLDADLSQSDARRRKAASVAPVSDALSGRVAAAEARRTAPAPEIGDADLLARAEAVRARGQRPVPAVDADTLLARAERARQKAAQTPTPAPAAPSPPRGRAEPVLSADFEERARRALERAEQARDVQP